MLGSGGVCSGPVSQWCSEVLRCSPKVAPDPGPISAPEPMSECEQCSIKFGLLRRRRECRNCGMLYCGTCLKRGVDGGRWCNKCLVLSKWPLNLSEVTALRVKDLRQFLHSHHINTATCTEKRELIDLVVRHISSQHRTTSIHHPPTVPQRPSSRTSSNSSKHKPPPRNLVMPQDDGIRVRPGSNISVGSIRVRPMDNIRMRPGCPVSPDPNNDAGIRVFASEQHNSQDTPSSTSPTSPASYTGYLEGEEECSHCPSDEGTASCCSLDSCHNVTSNQPHPSSHHVETSSQNSGEWVFLPEQSSSSCPRDDSQESGDREISASIPLHHTGVVVENGNPAEEIVDFPQPSAPLQPLSEQEEPSVAAPTLSSSSSASSSTPASAVSSPEPSKGVIAGIVSLGDLKSMEEIHQLSVRQCKELLTLHRVNYSGVREKSELFDKVKILWDDYRTSRQELENLPEELICKICMDSAMDCVLLECGHMVACTQCGKQMSECPLCRQYVVRVVRTFRA